MVIGGAVMANYLVHNITTNERRSCTELAQAWALIDPDRADDDGWLGRTDRWEILHLMNTLTEMIAWGIGPSHKDTWLRDHHFASH
jgi:hypothetical protein